MHITILALGSRGDIQPYASLGHGLKSAGHQVRFITFENFAELVTRNELDFHPIHGNSQSLVVGAGADILALMRSFGSLAEGYARDLSAPHLGDTDLIVNRLHSAESEHLVKGGRPFCLLLDHNNDYNITLHCLPICIHSLAPETMFACG
jgi:hypothetical protein